VQENQPVNDLASKYSVSEVSQELSAGGKTGKAKSLRATAVCYGCMGTRPVGRFIIVRGDGRKPQLLCIDSCKQGEAPFPVAEVEAVVAQAEN
jgi:hypothetical protein